MSRRVEALSRSTAGPISLLHQACFPEDPWDAEAIAQIMKIPGFFGQIGWEGEAPAGFALGLALGEEAEIAALGVGPAHRRWGMGGAILDAMCGEARSRGADRVLLEVAIDNAAARALYAGRGFTVIGCRRDYYYRGDRRVDALILRAELPAAILAT
jgi:[ribosomal protein S18]-alanine N-acetyltransferase